MRLSVLGKISAFPLKSGEADRSGPSGVRPSGQLDYGYDYTPSASGYGQVVNRAALTTTSTVTVQLNCSGNSASINQKKLTAVKVSQLANLTGPDVAKTSFRPAVGR